MVKILLFDADGVIIQAPGYGSVHALESSGLDTTLLDEFFANSFLDCERGKKDLIEEMKPYLKNTEWENKIPEFLKVWFDYEHILEQSLLNKIQELRNQGIVCCLTTTQEKYRWQYMKQDMGLQKYFDHLYAACDIGYLKAESGFFESVYTDIKNKYSDLKKQEVLLWDDDEECVDLAHKFGFEAEVYVEFEDFERRIGKYID